MLRFWSWLFISGHSTRVTTADGRSLSLGNKNIYVVWIYGNMPQYNMLLWLQEIVHVLFLFFYISPRAPSDITRVEHLACSGLAALAATLEATGTATWLTTFWDDPEVNTASLFSYILTVIQDLQEPTGWWFETYLFIFMIQELYDQ